MCLDSLKKNRNWVLWISGFFGIVSLISLILVVVNSPITAFGITFDRNLHILRFVVTGMLSYLLLRYWGKAQRKRR